MKLGFCLALLGAMAAGSAKDCWAWGATGCEWISGIAIEKLPDGVPEFIRTQQAANEVAGLGRQLDRSQHAGQTHVAERESGHYIELEDNGFILGVLPLSRLPGTREEYDTLLREKGFTQYQAGYLPYAIIVGWQRIRKDFVYWRALKKAAEIATNTLDRSWFEADQWRREKLIIHNIGMWSHYVGDAAQPLQVSVHRNGWGNYPNPRGYATKDIQAYFEGEFVKSNLTRAVVAADVGTFQECKCSIEMQTLALLTATLAQVEPLYALEKEGGFKKRDKRGVAFATARLAAGATVLRNMIVEAWIDSANGSIGHPMVNVRDIESGKVLPKRELFRVD